MTEKKQNKNRHFNFRVNEKEYNQIKSKIEKSKLNTSEYLLRTAMDKDIIVRWIRRNNNTIKENRK